MSASPETDLPPGDQSANQGETISETPSGASVLEVNVPENESESSSTTPQSNNSPQDGKNVTDSEIDSTFEYNIKNGHCFPEESLSFTSFKLDALEAAVRDLDADMDSDVEMEIVDNKIDADDSGTDVSASMSQVFVSDSNIGVGEIGVSGSEHSFTSVSGADSSLLAQKVVSRVLENAVKVAQQGNISQVSPPLVETLSESLPEQEHASPASEADNMDVNPHESNQGKTSPVASVEDIPDEPEQEKTAPAVSSGDVKVGLFQYSRDPDGSEDEQSDRDAPAAEKPRGDTMVGLFQYHRTDSIESPSSSEEEEEAEFDGELEETEPVSLQQEGDTASGYRPSVLGFKERIAELGLATRDVEIAEGQAAEPGLATQDLEIAEGQIAEIGLATRDVDIAEGQAAEPGLATRDLEIAEGQVAEPGLATRDLEIAEGQVAEPGLAIRDLDIAEGQTEDDEDEVKEDSNIDVDDDINNDDNGDDHDERGSPGDGLEVVDMHRKDLEDLHAEMCGKRRPPGEGGRDGMVISEDAEDDRQALIFPSSGGLAMGQYQPLMENGKFRIVKNNEASPIRIGSERSSPGSGSPRSQGSTPREKVSEIPVRDTDRSENIASIDGGESGPTTATVSDQQQHQQQQQQQQQHQQHQQQQHQQKDESEFEHGSGDVSAGVSVFVQNQHPGQEIPSRGRPIEVEDYKPEHDYSPPASLDVRNDFRSRYEIIDGNRYRAERDIEGRDSTAETDVPLQPDVRPNRFVDRQDQLELSSSERHQPTGLEGEPSQRMSSPPPTRSDRQRSTSPPVRESEARENTLNTYQTDLIQSAYDRVAWHTGRPSTTEYRDTSRTTSSLNTTSSMDSSHIPGYKTLQEQQASWTNMFETLEDQHKIELRSQYLRHQENIRRMQEQMENELSHQHSNIRKKLDDHKVALKKVYPEGGERSSSLDRQQRSPERGQRAEDKHTSSRSEEQPHVSPKLQTRSAENGNGEPLEELQLTEESKTWREIYQEVRAEEEKREPTPPPPLRRTLEADLDVSEVTPVKSRSPRISPRPSSTKKESRPNNDEQISRSDYELDRESRSRTRQSPRQPVQSPSEAFALSSSSYKQQQETVSPYIKELLDNLKDGRSSLPVLTRGLESPPSKRESLGSTTRPRAGVYSSPMPLLRGKPSKRSVSPTTVERSRLETSRLESSSLDVSQNQRSPSSKEKPRESSSYLDTDRVYDDRERDTTTEKRSRSSRDSDRDEGNLDNSRGSWRNDDTYMSSSTRMNLREKHAKHLADLRTYYEEELRELRKALSMSTESSGVLPLAGNAIQVGMQNQLLEAEHRHLVEKCRTLEDELDESYMRVREMEQKCRGLEKRSSEYSAAHAEAQATGIQNKAHIEELQRYCRDRDSFVNSLEGKLRAQEDHCKIYKKNLEEEMEHHRRDKNSLGRVVDKYESLEREHNHLKDTLVTAETKLYESRSESVELNRKISKLELENKRIGRENDNLRHKVTQSLNLSSHEAFGSPQSPRETTQQSNMVQSRDPGYGLTQRRSDIGVNSETTYDTRPISSGMNPIPFSKAPPRTDRSAGQQQRQQKQQQEQQPKSNWEPSAPEPQRRSRQFKAERESSPERASRDVTPPRQRSSRSPPESESAEYSPVIKAERELYKLRDMMRQAVAVKPVEKMQEPVLQKKFYGSERAKSKEEFVIDLSTPRGRREKPSSHSSVTKTKSSHSSSVSKGEKSSPSKNSRGDKSRISKTDKGEHSHRKTASGKSPDRHAKQKERHSSRDRTPTRKDKEKQPTTINLQPEELNSSTRFDVNINAVDSQSNSAEQRNGQPQKRRSLFEPSEPIKDQQRNGKYSEMQTPWSSQTDPVENTLDRMRAGDYVSRPQWEDVYTSMAKPKPNDPPVPTLTKEEKIRNRMKEVAEMETRYDNLQGEKRQLESSISKIPMHGRVDRHKRQQKEELETRLDKVDKDLGSLRMSLKRCNVLKTAA